MPTEVMASDVIQEEEPVESEGSSSEVEEETVDRPSSTDKEKSEKHPTIQRELADSIVRLASVDELKILLACGAKVSQPVTQGLTPLHYAVWQRYPEAAEFLIKEGCDINARDDIGYSALHLSAEHGYTDMMKVLLDAGAIVNFNFDDPLEEYPTNATDEPLRLALKHDHSEAAKMLLEHGANPNTRYFFGAEVNLVNPFNTELLQLLLSYGADPNSRDRQGFTPLMKACRLHQGMEAVLLLISFGANVNARCDGRHDYRSVLHYAVLSGSVAIVNLLVKQGAIVQQEDDHGKPSPLDLAILKGDIEAVKLLIEEGANVNSSTPIIGTPLHMACSEGIPNRLDVIKLLLEKGANPNHVVTGEDGSPLRPALGEYLTSNDSPDVQVVNILLKYGAKVVMQSQNRDPQGILNSLPNLMKHPDVLITLLEAAQKFDLAIIRNSSFIDDDQREFFLKVGQSPMPLKHITRVFLRQNLGGNLPTRIDDLELPAIMKKYLLYEIS
ncbi:uncharacterized protein LOC143039048 isoform X2 [Oratosquilla oratoria]|uniref:uncharacterized protein LOC143039048 isoform X2 n=1 Tax=Oratosquilla oratoria TaxID=337810 RepID=UPI003F765C6E